MKIRMKCLSVCQPWAWTVIHGDKPWENRTWHTSYRGPLAIHAGKSLEYMKLVTPGEIPNLPPERELVFGAVLGVSFMHSCVQVHEIAGEPYAEGPFCFGLRDRRPLKCGPLPLAGRQGFFEIELDEEAGTCVVVESAAKMRAAATTSLFGSGGRAL